MKFIILIFAVLMLLNREIESEQNVQKKDCESCNCCGGCLSLKLQNKTIIECFNKIMPKKASLQEASLTEDCTSCDCCGGCCDIYQSGGTLITCKKCKK